MNTTSGHTADEQHRTHPADATAPVAICTAVHEWLDQLEWPSQDVADLLAATHEAVSNVVSHAYRPPVEDQLQELVWLRATTTAHPSGQRRVIIEITDTGTWKPNPSATGHHSGGLAFMRACVGVLSIHTGKAGTRVILIGRPVTPPARRFAATSGQLTVPPPRQHNDRVPVRAARR